MVGNGSYQVGDGPQAAAHITNRRPGDLDEDGYVTALDLGGMIDLLFAGASPPTRPGSGDVNAIASMTCSTWACWSISCLLEPPPLLGCAN